MEILKRVVPESTLQGKSSLVILCGIILHSLISRKKIPEPHTFYTLVFPDAKLLHTERRQRQQI